VIGVSDWGVHPMSDADDQRSKIIAGVVAVALGVAGFAYCEGKEDRQAACTLSAAGVTAIATGLSRGRNAQSIIALAGPTLGAAACRDLVEALVEQPSTPVPVTVNLGDEFRPGRVTASDFIPPTPSRPRTCLDWIDPSVELRCLRGEFSPPPF
jgi:hypothetical protein